MGRSGRSEAQSLREIVTALSLQRARAGRVDGRIARHVSNTWCPSSFGEPSPHAIRYLRTRAAGPRSFLLVSGRPSIGLCGFLRVVFGLALDQHPAAREEPAMHQTVWQDLRRENKTGDAVKHCCTLTTYDLQNTHAPTGTTHQHARENGKTLQIMHP
jgi:hypothetical protein